VTEVDTRTVEQTIRIAARPETVWEYWTDPELLREWWGAAGPFDVTTGGEYRIAMKQHDPSPVMGGQFLELVPHERIVFSFGWEPAEGLPDIPVGSSRVEVTLVADGTDTVLTLRHSGIPPVYAADHGVGWSQHLEGLARILAAAT
jgi:uncharacterized protein YndB with AHSA1/START domain